RFLQLINNILEDRRKAKNFYQVTIEEEYLDNVKKHPGLPYTYQHLIRYHLENRNPAEVEKWEKLYLQRFKDHLQLYESISFFCFKKELYWEAIHYIENCAQYGTPRVELLFKQALSYRFLEKYDNAEKIFRQLLNSKPKKDLKKEMLYELGLAQLLKGELEAAIGNLKKSLKIKGNYKDINYRANYRLGELYVKKEQYRQARPYLERCLVQCPNHRAAAGYLTLSKEKCSYGKLRK
ncbi:MAG: tetratricopeptide repeat protein, partial [bacterium]|nr:tetratricopeptide repeat protein [bacterium]